MVRRMVEFIDRRLQRVPELRQATVTATSSPTISVQYPEADAPITGVRCVGFGAITLPSVSDEVWVLSVNKKAAPICIGKI
jgi:hypothetical protein